jgi:aminopeptidase-like protein
MNDACDHEPISFIHNPDENESFTEKMKLMNGTSKNMSQRCIAPNEKNIPLVTTTHRDQWNFCCAQQNFCRKAYDASSYGSRQKFYTMR